MHAFEKGDIHQNLDFKNLLSKKMFINILIYCIIPLKFLNSIKCLVQVTVQLKVIVKYFR